MKASWGEWQFFIIIDARTVPRCKDFRLSGCGFQRGPNLETSIGMRLIPAGFLKTEGSVYILKLCPEEFPFRSKTIRLGYDRSSLYQKWNLTPKSKELCDGWCRMMCELENARILQYFSNALFATDSMYIYIYILKQRTITEQTSNLLDMKPIYPCCWFMVIKTSCIMWR